MDAVLHRIWEREESIFFAYYFSEILERGALVLETIDYLASTPITLFVGEVDATLHMLAKCE